MNDETLESIVTYLDNIMDVSKKTINRMRDIIGNGGILSDDDVESFIFANARVKGALIALRILSHHNGSNASAIKATMITKLDDALDPKTGNLHTAQVLNNVILRMEQGEDMGNILPS